MSKRKARHPKLIDHGAEEFDAQEAVILAKDAAIAKAAGVPREYRSAAKAAQKRSDEECR
jgi:hypothetical protein